MIKKIPCGSKNVHNALECILVYIVKSVIDGYIQVHVKHLVLKDFTVFLSISILVLITFYTKL